MIGFDWFFFKSLYNLTPKLHDKDIESQTISPWVSVQNNNLLCICTVLFNITIYIILLVLNIKITVLFNIPGYGDYGWIKNRGGDTVHLIHDKEPSFCNCKILTFISITVCKALVLAESGAFSKRRCISCAGSDKKGKNNSTWLYSNHSFFSRNPKARLHIKMEQLSTKLSNNSFIYTCEY